MSETDKAPTEKQQRVLDAALEMFADRGYAGVATNEIAKKAGVAEGTIFKNWKTKKDLLVAVVAPLFFKLVAPRLLDELTELVGRPWPDAESLLRALLSNRMAFVKEHQRTLRIVLQEMPFHPEIRQMAVDTVVARAWPALEAAWLRLQREGKVRADVPPHAIARNVAGAFVAWLIFRFVLAADRPWDENAEEDFVIRLLLDGVRPH